MDYPITNPGPNPNSNNIYPNIPPPSYLSNSEKRDYYVTDPIDIIIVLLILETIVTMGYAFLFSTLLIYSLKHIFKKEYNTSKQAKILIYIISIFLYLTSLACYVQVKQPTMFYFINRLYSWAFSRLS